MEGELSYERVVESLKATELTLGLPGTGERSTSTRKRTLEKANESDIAKSSAAEDEVTPPKAQVVGWPPVRSYRKSSFQARKTDHGDEASGIFVKVSMDGAPYLRKIDLGLYKGYKELREGLENMFKSFSSLGEGGSCSAITYEDKDGDWMLVGDVPWGMFISTCKRLRIMRGCSNP